MTGRDRPIPLATPHLCGNELAYLTECIESNYVSSIGPFVERFERAFAKFVGTKHAVACASGTAALHLAMIAVGVGPNSYGVAPTLTFIASANAIRYTGAEVMLVDAERRTWNMDPGLVEADVKRRARAGHPLPSVIEAVHILGHPAQVEVLLTLRDKYGIPIVEDAAEALGARYATGPLAGRQVGAIGDLGCFSFNGNKTMTTGGGGMVVTNDWHLAERVRHLSTQARLPGVAYDHDAVGFNYRLTNIAAALGLAQLEQLPRLLARKSSLAARYDAAFGDLPVELPPRSSDAVSSHWLYSLLVDTAHTRDEMVRRLNVAGIEARPLWPPLHTQQPYRHAPIMGGLTAMELAARGVSLPSGAGLTNSEQARTIDGVREVLCETRYVPSGPFVYPG